MREFPNLDNQMARSGNNGFAEAVNSLIQTTKRVARGFRNRTNFINMCFYKNGHLEMMF